MAHNKKANGDFSVIQMVGVQVLFPDSSKHKNKNIQVTAIISFVVAQVMEASEARREEAC